MVQGRSEGFQEGSVVAKRYRIDGQAGRGGMGVVYRAYDLRFGRVVALKVIATDLIDDRAFRRRFEAEITSAAQIEHPHVVPVYDSGEEAGQLFVVMRFIEGTNLADLIARRRRLDAPLAAQIVGQVAAALDAAHARGLVHRDVKPANVLIADGEDVHAYLTDFGVAKGPSARTTAGGALTRHGMMVGTVEYMSPEQAEGHEVDRRADVYALGSVLYETLTGKLPYPGNTAVSILVAKLSDPAPVPSAIDPALPPEFDTIILCALARDPNDRYQTTGELGRAAVKAAAAVQLHETVVPHEIGPGSVLADCVIEQVLGEGGMAVVYRATQLKLGRHVALKVMARELATDTSFQARFEREWRLAAALDHPNIIPIYWAGEDNGLLYVVMRLVEGRNLREILRKQGALEPERAVTVIEQVASALDAAHQHGLLHRDVKPGNVLVEDSTGYVYLTDFGLAKEIDDEDDLTGSGQLLGTTRYIAPERTRGLGAEDARADIYSLGCLLWDLLGGIERRQLPDVPGVPPALAAVVVRAVELEPSARFSSAGELAQAARAALGGDPARAAGPGALGGGVSGGAAEPFGPEPLSSGLCLRVAAVCDLLLESLDGEEEDRDRIAAVQHALRDPLRLAIVGPPEAGKSTLTNALLGRRALPTGAGASKPAEIWCEFGASDRLETVQRHENGASGDDVPPGVGARSLTRLWLAVDLLQSLTLVIATTNAPGAESEASDFDTLLTELATDAVMFVQPADRRDDAERQVETILASPGLSAVNTIVALTKADVFADDEEALRAVGELHDRLGLRAAAVVPIRGVIAETANVGILTDQDTELVATLATLGHDRRAVLLGDAGAFMGGDSPIGLEGRRRLLELMGIYGIRRALELSDAEQLSTIALIRRLRELSGIEDLTREIQRFHQRADALKARRALDQLEALSYTKPSLAPIRDLVEEVRYEPEMHVLDLARAYDRCVSETIDIPAQLLAQLQLLITGRSLAERLGQPPQVSPEELRAAARARLREWKVFENEGHASARARRVARVALRSYELIATRDVAGTPVGS